MDNLGIIIGKQAIRFIREYFKLIEIIAQAINPQYKHPKILKEAFNTVLGEERSESVDERIKKIDSARANLHDAIQAIDELHIQAIENKVELAKTLQNLAEAEQQKNETDKELDAVRQLANIDVAAFRSAAGIPGKNDIFKERIFGFISGVVASLIAGGIFTIFANINKIITFIVDFYHKFAAFAAAG